MTKCTICGGPLGQEYGCTLCRGARCAVCGEPIFRDESIANQGNGWRHVRCGCGLRLRPGYMPAVPVERNLL